MTGAPGLFAYGTLSLPPVLEALLGRPVAGEAATLEGWARYRVHGAVYPAIAPERGARTAGLLFPPLSSAELELVDRFEGTLYVRRRLEVTTAHGARAACAYTLAPGSEAALTDEPWEVEPFAARHLERYRSACRDFRRSAASSAR